ncbi:MAG: universal stress protein [Flavobacteriaceae bacterium]
MKNIAIPIGISDFAAHTLRYGFDLAQYFEATVYLIDAYPQQSQGSSHLQNIHALAEDKNFARIKSLAQSNNPQQVPVKILRSQQDLIGSIKKLDAQVGLDMIVVAPLNNDMHEKVFLGRIAGSLIKRTNIPVWVAPLEKAFVPAEKLMLALKHGNFTKEDPIRFVDQLRQRMQATMDLLFVQTPGLPDPRKQAHAELTEKASDSIYTENATVYQGVLEHFQVSKPDMLVVFKRERGFFEKLWEPDMVLKKDFYCTVPLLVLKP